MAWFRRKKKKQEEEAASEVKAEAPVVEEAKKEAPEAKPARKEKKPTPKPEPKNAEADPKVETATEVSVATTPEAKPDKKAEEKPAPPEKAAEEPPGKEKKGWLSRLKQGLGKSSSKISETIGAAVGTRRKLDDEALEELEDALIMADLGPSTAAKLVAQLSKRRFAQELTEEEIRGEFASDIAAMLEPVALPLTLDESKSPHVILVVGVNGSGKTTTIGKIAKQFRDEGRSVTLAAGDTFRAAAIEQLGIWGERTGCHVVAKEQGADAAGLAYDALTDAQNRGDDVLIVDTAGRLQNKTELMDELAKIIRVMRKIDETAPHTVLLVLDATTGQNAHSQVEVFQEMAHVSGLVVTKLDGTARGGVVVALAEKFGLPVHAIGVGEGAEDLRPFDAGDYARSLMGLE